MKRVLTFLCCMMIYSLTAQESLNCDLNYRLSLLYVDDSHGIEKDFNKVKEFLAPCTNSDDSRVLTLYSRMLLLEDNPESYKTAFNLLKKAAKMDNDVAMYELATLFKYGIGTKLSFKKSRKWYKKSIEIGNDKAKYGLGYLFLKGFGGENQNYKKAAKWFKESSYHMSDYWLGICYYYGYGVNKNLERAKELLGNNNFVQPGDELKEEELGLYNNLIHEFNKGVDVDNEINLSGQWSGHLLKLDWSGNHIEISQKLGFSVTEQNNNAVVEINSKNVNYQNELELISGTTYFENFNLKIPHISFKETIPNELTYEIEKIDFYPIELDDEFYLIGEISANISEFNEPSAPTIIILKREQIFNNTDDVVSESDYNALRLQKSFIKLFPVPFNNRLIVSYELEENSDIDIVVSDLYGNSIINVESVKNQNKGVHNYLVQTAHLNKGTYVVAIYVNGEKISRTILKN